MKKIGRLGNLNDLPDELKKELSISFFKDYQKQIVNVICGYGGEANINEILVGIYREYKIIYKRSDIIAKLHRMSLKGILKKVSGKKGVYQVIFIN